MITLSGMLKDIIVITMNSKHHIWTIKSREHYVNTAWQLMKQQERKERDESNSDNGF